MPEQKKTKKVPASPKPKKRPPSPADTTMPKGDEKCRIIFDEAAEGIVLMPIDGSTLWVNKTFARMHGYESPEEMLHLRLSDLDAPGTAARAPERLQRLIAGETLNFDVEHYRKDGSIFFLNVSCKVVDIEEKRYFLGLHQDITERKRVEEALRESEEKYRTLAEAAPQMIFLIDRHFRIQYVNSQSARAIGRPAEEIAGKSIDDIFPPELAQRHRRALGRVFETGEQLFTEMLEHFPTGDVWIEARLAPVRDEKGDIVGAIGLSSDITERKRAEERYRATIESSPVGMHFYRLEKEGRLVFVGANPAADRLLGVSNDRFIGKTIEDAFPPLVGTEIPDRYRHAALTGEKWSTEQVVYDHGGIRGAFNVLVFQNEPQHAVAMFFDITDRKRAEEEKEKLQAQLLQSQKMESVGRLAGGIAHDFNNMLSVILGHTEMLLDRLKPDDPLLHDLRKIHTAAERSADLTRQLLAFARKQTIAPQVLDLNATVRGMLDMLRRLIGEDIDLAWMPGADAGRVRMDPSQIDQILANLCVNARDAIADTGKITIETGVATFDDRYCATHAGYVPGDYALLAVSDSGCGMDTATVEHLFEPFFTTKERGKGTGLGLATVYGIVRQNCGFINVYSEPGRGTSFRIYLPRCAEEMAVLPAKKEPVSAPKSGGETILLVEDEPMIRDIARKMLDILGYRVIVAATPGEAIRLAREHAGTIHLLFTDVVMPEMNGRELARNILSLYPDIKRLFMSGYTANVIAHHGVLDPGVHFLQKPFSMNDLAVKVREALAGS